MSWSTRAQLDTRIGDGLANTGLPVKAQLAAGDLDEIIDGALEEYSRDSGRDRIHEQAGDGATKRFQLSTWTDWLEGYSFLKEIRLRPTAETDERGQILVDTGWEIVQEPDGDGEPESFLLLVDTIASDYTAFMRYSGLHILEDGTPINSIPQAHREAFFWLGMSHACTWIAQRLSDTRDQSINADAVSWDTVAGQFRGQAKAWKKLYDAAVLGIEKEGPIVAGRRAVEDQDASWDRATHFVRPRGGFSGA